MYRLAETPPWYSCVPHLPLLTLTSKSAKSWTMSTYSVSMVDSQCLLCHILITVLSDTQFNGLWDFIINICKCHDLKYLFTILPSRAWGLEMKDLEWFPFLTDFTPQRGGQERASVQRKRPDPGLGSELDTRERARTPCPPASLQTLSMPRSQRGYAGQKLYKEYLIINVVKPWVTSWNCCCVLCS